MDEKTPPVVVKEEPISDIENYYEPVSPLDPDTELSKPVFEPEDIDVQFTSKLPETSKKTKKSRKKVKRIKQEPSSFAVQEEKLKNLIKAKNKCRKAWQRTRSECLKKKLNGIRKEIKEISSEIKDYKDQLLEEKLNSVDCDKNYIRTLLETSKPEQDPCVEPPRAEVYPDRTMSDYYCQMCDARMNSVQVWESHIQGKRHLKNIQKASAAAAVTIKKEKADDVDGLYYIDTRGAESPLAESMSYEERPLSPAYDEKRSGRQHSSPEPPSPPPPPPPRAPRYATPANYGELNLTTVELMEYMQELSESIFPQNDQDVDEMKSIISSLSQRILQYEIRQLPFSVQQKLAKGLFKGK